MKVLCFPADDLGCGSYRMSWPAQYLKHLGHDVELALVGKRGQFRLRANATGDIIDVGMPEDVDVVVFQRISRKIHAEAFLNLRARGVAVVHDMDDDLGRIHGRSFAYSNYQDPSGHSWAHCELASRNATLVTVSTPALLDVYGFDHGHVIDNYVPGMGLEYERQDGTTIGWGGTTASHPNDLPVLGRAIRKLVDEGSQFCTVGPPSEVRAQLHLRHEPRYTGRVSQYDWIKELAKLGVGIAPLADTLFNAAKSRLKVAEMSAAGVPWVASPSPEYKRFHAESGTGILGSSPNEWYRALKMLVSNASVREEFSQAGRAYMASQTIELNAWRWWEAWTRAYELERGRSPE